MKKKIEKKGKVTGLHLRLKQKKKKEKSPKMCNMFA